MTERKNPIPLATALEYPEPYLAHLSMVVKGFIQQSRLYGASEKQQAVRDSWRLIKAAKWWKDLDRQKYGYSND